MILGLHHVALLTPEFDRLVGFYRHAVGATVVSERLYEGEEMSAAVSTATGVPGAPRLRSTLLRLGNAFLEIQQYLEPEGADERARPPQDYGIRHFALAVEDIDAEIARLEAAGLRLIGRLDPESPLTVRAVYARDPDGNIIELLEATDPQSPLRL